MCLLVLAWQSHPRYSLILAGNRDEFHQRPAAAADWWQAEPALLAGKDLAAGGTWLGVSRGGRAAVVTNYREAPTAEPAQLSRGELVPRFLRSSASPRDWSKTVESERFGGFNLLLFDARGGHYLSNRGQRDTPVESGVHGLSNHRLDTPWPKLVAARDRFARAIEADQVDADPLFGILSDRRQADSAALPDTGVPEEWERLLSAAFIVHPAYGTRASTVLTIEHQGRICFEERRFDADGKATGSSRFEFEIRE
ncbi:MAG: NRDE family protein [Gammaproteobacteria bacterium]